MEDSKQIRNIAIIAHVDHGKTTLVDGLLRQAGVFRANQAVDDRIMDSIDLEKERGITLVAKNASVTYKGVRINIVDTPGHADFGGEVERALQMVDGAILLVDSSEGPLPQTRFVVKHALELGIPIVVVVNKIDRKDARASEVLDEVYELFLNLEANDEQFDFAVVYTDARKQLAVKDPAEKDSDANLDLLFDTILERLPPPKTEEGAGRLLVANTGYDDYVGRLSIGKLRSGTLKVGDPILVHPETGDVIKAKITALYRYEGMRLSAAEVGHAGEILVIAGNDDIRIGDTVTSPENPVALPRVEIEPPTMTIELIVNSSPLAGRDGDRLTSRMLWDRIEKELRTNVSLRAERSESSDTFYLKGRGELQFAILAEQMRREGYEFMLGRPKVITKEINGEKHEPQDKVVMDIPEDALGRLTERLGTRKGEMANLAPAGQGRVRAEFLIPSRGLIGFSTEFMNITRGEGISSSHFHDYIPWKGHITDRVNGAMVADRAGETTAYALFNLEDRGKLLISEGVQVYEGMIVGENNRINDLNVNVTRGKKLTNVRASGKDEAVVLTPVTPLTIDKALAWIADDEVLEVTPAHLRLRKRELAQNKRSVVRSPKEES